MSNSLRPHELQHTRPPCPSPTPRVYSNSCPSSWSIQASHPLLSPSPPAPNPSQHQGLFQWVNSSHEVAKGGQSIEVSASASVLPMNTQDWSPLGWTGWTSLQPKGLSRVFSNKKSGGTGVAFVKPLSLPDGFYFYIFVTALTKKKMITILQMGKQKLREGKWWIQNNIIEE